MKPASSTSFAISMVTSMCSSISIMLMGSMPGALFQERCRWASIMPGISVAPMPSMTVAPPVAPRRTEARAAARDLLDAVALDEDLAGVGILAGRIEDADIGEEHRIRLAAVGAPARCVAVVGHSILPREIAVLGASASRRAAMPPRIANMFNSFDELRNPSVAFGGLLDRQPVAATIDRHELLRPRMRSASVARHARPD